MESHARSALFDVESAQIFYRIFFGVIPTRGRKSSEVLRADEVLSYCLHCRNVIDNVEWSSEIPVEMVRVLVDSDDVQFRVNGWPAAFWCRAGHGEVLLTTVDARAWYRPWRATDDRPKASRSFIKASSCSSERPP